MPWMGMGFITLQEQTVFGSPGGNRLYRVMATCACGTKMEATLAPNRRGEELTDALQRIASHWMSHMEAKTS